MIGWNKGLTKETSERVRRNAMNISKALKGRPKSKEHCKHMSEGKKRLYREGKLVPWNKGKKGVMPISWCKGLTKTTDERLAKYGKKISKTKKRLFRKGKLKTWCKGLRGEEYLSHFKDGRTWNKDKHLSKEHREKIRKNHWSKRGYTSWCKGLKGEEFLKHFKDGQMWNKGKHLSEEAKKRLSDTVKQQYKNGRKSPMSNEKVRRKASETMKRLHEEGKIKIPKWTEERRRKAGERMKLHSPMKLKKNREKMKKLWKNPEYRKRQCKMRKEFWKDPKYLKKVYKGNCRKPNSPEKILIELIKKNNFPFKYCGDFSVWLNGRNPDFINVNGEKQVIEFFGDYWHGKRMPKKDFSRTEWGKKKHYKEYGFDCLVIWEHELNNLDLVKNKISEFCGGN